jgi:hypothetical protein
MITELFKISSTLVSKITKTFIVALFIISGTRIKLPPLFIVTFPKRLKYVSLIVKIPVDIMTMLFAKASAVTVTVSQLITTSCDDVGTTPRDQLEAIFNYRLHLYRY